MWLSLVVAVQSFNREPRFPFSWSSFHCLVGHYKQISYGSSPSLLPVLTDTDDVPCFFAMFWCRQASEIYLWFCYLVCIQGLRWYAKRLRIDEDGDIADEFLNEVMEETPTNTEDHQRPFPRFEVKYSTRPAKVKNLVLSQEGKIQCVEHQGRLQWV